MKNGQLTVNITERGACLSKPSGFEELSLVIAFENSCQWRKLSVGREVTKVDVLEYSTNR